MTTGEWILFSLIVVHAAWAWKMLIHARKHQPTKKTTWLYMFYLTAGLASFYYYFKYKRTMDLERKKGNN